MDVHANILPMELALLKACHSALVRSLTLPNTNPVHQVIRKAKRNTPSKYPGPIDKLLKLFALKNIKIETIHPAVSLKKGPNQFSTKIDKSREDSIKFESTDEADFKIFSDGSGHDNGIGAASALYENGVIRSIKTLKAFLGTPRQAQHV